MKRHIRIRKNTRHLSGFIAIAFALTLMPGVVNADKVTDWNAIAVTAAVNEGRGAPAVGVDMAYVHLAVYDAVNAIDGRYSAFAVSPSEVPAGASQEAAAVAAAYRVLLALYPNQSAYLAGEYTLSIGTIADGTSKTDGINLGNEVAALFIAWRSGDGRNAIIPYIPDSGPGVWEPIAPATAPGFAWIAHMRPFALADNAQFRPEPPPALDSAEWAADFNEIKALGSINSTVRTPEQTEIGRFFLDNANVQAARGYRALALERGMSLADNARLFAMINASVADALIANFDSKFHYNFWRPLTAIRNADIDGNPETVADPTWTPLASTPNFPDYLGAHSSLTSAYCEALRQFFGTKRIHIVLTSSTTGTTREYFRTDDLVKEINDARVYSGFHFRTSDVRGAVLGRKVGKWIARNYFEPVE